MQRDEKIKQLLEPDASGYRKYTLEKVGKRFGLTRQRVNQIIGKVGRREQIKRLEREIDSIRRALFFDGTTTLDKLAKEYHLCRESVRVAVGSQNSYEVSVGLRKCNRCKKILPISEFYHNGTGIDRLCPPCANQRHAEWQVANREHVNAYMREYNKTEKRRKYIKEYRRTR